MLSSVDEILERACQKALPKILAKIEKNKAKQKYLKKVEKRRKLKNK